MSNISVRRTILKYLAVGDTQLCILKSRCFKRFFKLGKVFSFVKCVLSSSSLIPFCINPAINDVTK